MGAAVCLIAALASEPTVSAVGFLVALACVRRGFLVLLCRCVELGRKNLVSGCSAGAKLVLPGLLTSVCSVWQCSVCQGHNGQGQGERDEGLGDRRLHVQR